MNTILRFAAACATITAIGFAAVADEADNSYLKDLDIRQLPMVDDLGRRRRRRAASSRLMRRSIAPAVSIRMATMSC